MRFYWSEEMDELLRKSGCSATRMADALNNRFGLKLTRCAVLGRVKRLGLSKAALPKDLRSIVLRKKELNQKKNNDRKAKRWAANPSLELRAQRIKEKKENRQIMLSGGARPTSPEYRKHLPFQPEMTKAELRAMLKGAIENTARMESA